VLVGNERNEKYILSLSLKLVKADDYVLSIRVIGPGTVTSFSSGP
jgi:hypothetical protein